MHGKIRADHAARGGEHLAGEPKRATLEIPEGAVFEMEGDGLVISFREDVVIRGNPGHRLKKVFSENGTIELRSPNEIVVESIETRKGSIVIAGSVRAKSLKGAKISLLEGHLNARSVNGEQLIELKGGTIEADLVMSPHVTVSAQVRGRATVIECQNDIGPHALKGGFKMAEFLEMMPSAQKVIQSEASHMPALSRGTPPPPPTETWSTSARVVEEPTGTAQTAAAHGDASEENTSDPAASGEASADGNWMEHAADGGQVDAEAPAQEEPPPPPEPERPAFHASLAEMCDQITKVYGAQNLKPPPPVARLAQLVDQGEYASVKSQLTTIWNQLIQFHKESKLPFAVKTTQMFQSIQRTLAQNVQA